MSKEYKTYKSEKDTLLSGIPTLRQGHNARMRDSQPRGDSDLSEQSKRRCPTSTRVNANVGGGTKKWGNVQIHEIIVR